MKYRGCDSNVHKTYLILSDFLPVPSLTPRPSSSKISAASSLLPLVCSLPVPIKLRPCHIRSLRLWVAASLVPCLRYSVAPICAPFYQMAEVFHAPCLTNRSPTAAVGVSRAGALPARARHSWLSFVNVHVLILWNAVCWCFLPRAGSVAKHPAKLHNPASLVAASLPPRWQRGVCQRLNSYNSSEVRHLHVWSPPSLFLLDS